MRDRNKNAKPEKAGMIILLPKGPLNPFRKSPLIFVTPGRESWNWVIAPRVERVTAHNSSQPQVNSLGNAVRPDCIVGIMRTAGRKAAGLGKQR